MVEELYVFSPDLDLLVLTTSEESVACLPDTAMYANINLDDLFVTPADTEIAVTEDKAPWLRTQP